MKKKIKRPDVKNYGMMNHPNVTPSNIAGHQNPRECKQHNNYEYSASSSAEGSIDEHTLNTRRVGRPQNKDRRTPTRDHQAPRCSSSKN